MSTSELNTKDAEVNQQVSGASQQVSALTLGTPMPAQVPTASRCVHVYAANRDHAVGISTLWLTNLSAIWEIFAIATHQIVPGCSCKQLVKS